ncbi:hypothetical protein M6B38_117800 [Iris pallida]|uniref:Uncharacterized protein n=1 Tax=Iris pallida TaxID=29817 RepID=A0AAX6HIT2_IRIPA|nr:hypothetical protein M6B38_117800 [Iris pallida]
MALYATSRRCFFTSPVASQIFPVVNSNRSGIELGTLLGDRSSFGKIIFDDPEA